MCSLLLQQELELKKWPRVYEMGHKRYPWTKGKELNRAAGGKSEMGIRRVYEALRMISLIKN